MPPKSPKKKAVAAAPEAAQASTTTPMAEESFADIAVATKKDEKDARAPEATLQNSPSEKRQEGTWAL